MFFVSGHEIKMTRNGQKVTTEDFTSEQVDTIVEDINYCIVQGDTEGVITTDDDLLDVEWDIISPTYLQEKIKNLDEENTITLEHNSLIYQIWYSDEYSGFMYECYDLSSFISGDTLESLDGGLCTGSAKDAIEMAIGETI